MLPAQTGSSRLLWMTNIITISPVRVDRVLLIQPYATGVDPDHYGFQASPYTVLCSYHLTPALIIETLFSVDFQLDWPISEAPRTVIDIVHGSTPERVFHGVFALSLAPHCWTGDSRHILFSSPARSRQVRCQFIRFVSFV